MITVDRKLIVAGALIGAAVTPALAHVSETARLLASDGQPGDRLGYSVSVDGTWVAGGAPYHDGGTSDEGAVYVYVQTSATTFAQNKKITAFDAAMDDRFGEAVGIFGDTLVVGVPQDDDDGSESGSVYVYVNTGTDWAFQAKLTASDAAAGDLFGSALDLEADLLLVGAPGDDVAGVGADAGSVYVFERSGTTWTETDQLGSNDHSAGDAFGAAVAIAGADVEGNPASPRQIIVGAPNDSDVVAGGGSAYVFDEVAGVFTEDIKLTDSNATAGDAFGSGVDILDGRAIVGSPFEDTLATDSGSLFVYEDNSPWSEFAQYTGSFALASREMGTCTAMSNRILVGGARLDDALGKTDAGNLYTWFPEQSFSHDTYTLSDPEMDAHYGQSVATSDCWVVSGADLADDLDTDAGAVYVSLAIHHFDTYCTSGTSASGCNAFINAIGTPSATAPGGFSVFVSGLEGQKDGLFYFSTNGKQANNWGNGTSYQCVATPVVRTPVIPGAGTAGACNGFPILDMNAMWCPSCPKPSKNPGPGAMVHAQYWYRDPQNTSNQTTSLSNAIEFRVCP